MLVGVDGPEVDPTDSAYFSLFAAEGFDFSDQSRPCLFFIRPGSRSAFVEWSSTQGAGVDFAEFSAPTGLTAGRLLVSKVQQALQSRGLASALHVAHQLGALLTSQVLVSNLNDLSHPSPSLLQSARSIFPGAQFSVVTGAREAVESSTRISGDAELVPIATGVGGQPLPWMTSALPSHEQIRQFSHSNVEQYGCQSWAETVWVPEAEAPAVSSPPQPPVRETRCNWCDHPTVINRCDFCGNTTSRMSRSESN